MNAKIVALVKREFWEHKGLWLVPAVAAVLFIAGGIFGGMHFNVDGVTRNGVELHIGRGASGMIDPQAAGYIGSVSLLVLASYLAVFTGIAVFTYLLDCLFAERKDRSILFWKSLPVSDGQTVAAKLVVAMLLVPALVLVLVVVLQPLIAGIVSLRFPELRPLTAGFVSGGFSAIPHLVIAGVFGLLWYLPLATYLMLASVVAKRAPLMYAVIPPVALAFAEDVFLDTEHIHRFLGERVFPWAARAPHLFTETATPGMVKVGGDWWVLFQDPKLWLGLVAAAGMMYLVVRLRRYRDDT